VRGVCNRAAAFDVDAERFGAGSRRVSHTGSTFMNVGKRSGFRRFRTSMVDCSSNCQAI